MCSRGQPTGASGTRPATCSDSQTFGALRTAVLDPNPDPCLPDEQKDWNAGHWMLSTENATVFGHGINRDGYTGTNIGSRFPFSTSVCPCWINRKS